MTGLRFKVGELATLVVARTPYSQQFLDQECEIVQCGPWSAGTECGGDGGALPMNADYVVMFSDCQPCIVADHQLRKIEPPAEPASLTRESECEVMA